MRERTRRSCQALGRLCRDHPAYAREMARRARRLHHPVRVPGLAAVERERLLPPERVPRFDDPRVADANRDALEHVVALEDADAVLEAPHDRLVEQAVADRRRPPDSPEPGARLEEPQRKALEAGPPREVRRAVR